MSVRARSLVRALLLLLHAIISVDAAHHREEPQDARVLVALLTDLRAEALSEPLLLDAPAPRLSWAVSGSALPTAYRVVAGVSAALAPPLLWDSGVFPYSALPAGGVPYAGTALPDAFAHTHR